jgi:8-demethyl-8-alpha-L-rhamnosyltetracenomycin-C 2'-O-methyltransferase
MDILTKLAIKYKTDKWGKKHHYTPVYYSLFRNQNKRRRVKKVLEIGVAEGAGLRMFRDFFPNAIIYGAEIDDKRLILEEGIQTFKCDQSKKDDLVNLLSIIGTDIDLVVDDGSHKPQDQVYTCLSIMPALKKGCIYVIEDVSDIRIVEPIKKFYKPSLVKVGDRYDDCLLIIKNG